MTNKIEITSFQGGLSNDRNVGQAGSFWDSSSVEVRKNSEYITLNRAVTESFNTGASRISTLALTNYYGGNITQEINAFCEDGRIYSAVEGEIGLMTDTYIANVINANGYYYILGQNYIHRFTNGVKENILASGGFSTGWSGANWSSGTHTPGSTAQYSQTVSTIPVVGEKYHLVIDVFSQSAGTCTITFGGVTSSNLAVGVNHIYVTATNAFTIFFNPSSTSTIVLSSIRVDRVSDLAVSNGLGVKSQIATLTSNVLRRPAINFFGDLIIGDGNQVARYNKDGTTYLYSTTTEGPVIGGLDGNVYSITQIGSNIYVWCNNGGSTNMYIWDGLSSRPTQKINNADKPVINVALLNNQHYWWAEKGILSQKHIMLSEGYQAQRYITSDIPKALATETLDDPDRLAIYGQNTNAIETFGDIVYYPGYGKVFGFGKYFPGDKIALTKEFTFNGSECTAMLTTSMPTIYQDFTFYMLIAYVRSGVNYVGIIDMRDWNGGYASSGYIETMEYTGGNIGMEKNQKKLLVPFYLPHDSTSINVYERKNQASSYTLIKTIDSTTYPSLGFAVAEISDSGKWNTIQWKFELITSNATYSPRLYNGINNILLETANRNG